MFSSAFLPQQHKAVNGFHLNHDNLIVLESKDRQKVITYFIAQQNPEKLDPADRSLIKASTARRPFSRSAPTHQEIGDLEDALDRMPRASGLGGRSFVVGPERSMPNWYGASCPVARCG